MTTTFEAARKAHAPERAFPPLENHLRTDPGLPRNSHPSGDPEIFKEAITGLTPAWKRILDILCILISLPLTVPLMAAITLWIKIVSRGPALFRQERIGFNGERFILYKFRSMRMNADTRRHENHFRHLVRTGKPMVKLDLLCDSRLIFGGCLLRASGLDELPQLLNVLRGEMSLVGPRPCLAEEYRFFSGKYRRRFSVLPGITGIWQVYGKGSTTFKEMNSMDAFYVRRFSALMDLDIILRTPIALAQQMRQALRQKRAAGGKPPSEYSEDPAFSGYNPQRLG